MLEWKCQKYLNLYSTHEEADSSIFFFFHLYKLSNENSVVVRNCDRDCLIIALGCMPKIES